MVAGGWCRLAGLLSCGALTVVACTCPAYGLATARLCSFTCEVLAVCKVTPLRLPAMAAHGWQATASHFAAVLGSSNPLAGLKVVCCVRDPLQHGTLCPAGGF
jgi:hypothetical protein